MQVRELHIFIDVFQQRIKFFTDLADKQITNQNNSKEFQAKLHYFKKLLLELEVLVLKEFCAVVQSKNYELYYAFHRYSEYLEVIKTVIETRRYDEIDAEVHALYFKAFLLKTRKSTNPIYTALEIGAAVIGGIVGAAIGPILGVFASIEQSFKTCGFFALFTAWIAAPVGAVVGLVMGSFTGLVKGHDLAHQRLGSQTKIYDKTKKIFSASNINLLFNNSAQLSEEKPSRSPIITRSMSFSS